MPIARLLVAALVPMVIPVLAVPARVAQAQEYVPAAQLSPPADPPASIPPQLEPAPAPPTWTYQRQTGNPQGTVTNTHRYLTSPEDGRTIRQHVVTNPRGELTQTWERVSTDDGYQMQRTQTWTSPDGTPLPHDERMLHRPAERSPVIPAIRPTAAPAAEQGRWWRKLNPFGPRDRESTAAHTTMSVPRRGFTVGTPQGNPAGTASLRSADRSVPRASQAAARPSWAGSGASSLRSPGPPSWAGNGAAASRPTPPRGPRR